MTTARKIDRTGRSAGPFTGREARLYKPPPGVPWVWVLIPLLESPAYQALSINARRIFEFLLIQHRNHNQLENGRLMATYDQLERFGVSRRLIRPALAELHAGGIVRTTRPGGMLGGERVAAQYRLTMYADVSLQRGTNEWKGATAAQVIAARENHADDREARKGWRDARKKRATGSQA